MYDSVQAVAEALDRLMNSCREGTGFCGPYSGADIINEMRKEVIPGFVGPIGFNGSDAVFKAFSYIQATGLQKDNVIGSFIDGKAYINYSALIFHPNNQIPMSAIVPIVITLSDAGGVIMCCLSVLLIAISVLLMIIFWVFREKKPIKKASPLFCELMLVGIIMVSLSIILFTVEKTVFTCNAKMWILALGYGLILGNLLAKTYRIFKIFSNINVSTTAIKDRDLLLFSAAILFIYTLSLCLYSFAGGIVKPTIVYSEIHPLTSFLVCTSVESGDAKEIVAVSFLMVVGGSLISLLAIVAYLTRNIDSAFNESMYIAGVVYLYVIIFLATMPTYTVSRGSENSDAVGYYEITISTFLAMLSTLVLLFGPKLYYLWKDYRKMRKKIERSTEMSSLSNGSIRIFSYANVSNSFHDNSNHHDNGLRRSLFPVSGVRLYAHVQFADSSDDEGYGTSFSRESRITEISISDAEDEENTLNGITQHSQKLPKFMSSVLWSDDNELDDDY